jgi:hypothetical protein
MSMRLPPIELLQRTLGRFAPWIDRLPVRYSATMARRQKLKVYRTPIGFHDAYVAATSQREALKAWGADVDLFARGVAEAVTDEALARAPLEKPGEVVRVVRGTNDEHMAALPETRTPLRRRAPAAKDDEGPPRRQSSEKRRRAARSSTAAPKSGPPKRETEHKVALPEAAPKRRRRPRPSRAKLEAAEAAIEKAQISHGKRIAAIRAKEKALRQERADIARRHESELATLEAALTNAREDYAGALKKWRD